MPRDNYFPMMKGVANTTIILSILVRVKYNYH